VIAYDLPAGGRRLDQAADGYVATVVSGEVIASNGGIPTRTQALRAHIPRFKRDSRSGSDQTDGGKRPRRHSPRPTSLSRRASYRRPPQPGFQPSIFAGLLIAAVSAGQRARRRNVVAANKTGNDLPVAQRVRHQGVRAPLDVTIPGARRGRRSSECRSWARPAMPGWGWVRERRSPRWARAA